MSDPRYRPCDFTLEPEAFGKALQLRWQTVAQVLEEHPEWRANPKIAEARIKAAQLQHLFAVRIRARLRHHGLKPAAYARLGALPGVASGSNPADRINKILRGAVIMRLEDIAMADVILGEVSDSARAQAAKDAASKAR